VPNSGLTTRPPGRTPPATSPAIIESSSPPPASVPFIADYCAVMTNPSPRSVHLFHDNSLVGSLDMTDPAVAKEYELNGVRYRVISSIPIIESDGTRGFDVQVIPT
jgi:hypothetical protein